MELSEKEAEKLNWIDKYCSDKLEECQRECTLLIQNTKEEADNIKYQLRLDIEQAQQELAMIRSQIESLRY